MAHRGRLNVLAHTLGRPYEYDPARVRGRADARGRRRRPRGRHRRRQVPPRRAGAARDTRAGESPSRSPRTRATSRRSTRSSRAGRAREQTDRSRRRARPRPDRRAADPDPRRRGVPGPGRRRRDAQPRRPRRLLDRRHAAPDREQPDRLHDRSRARAARRATRATSPRASTSRSSTSTPTTPRPRSRAIRLALAFRRRFGHDVVVDLVGYRRFGHNEQDEAAYTQPLMAERIAAHPTVRELYAAQLVEEGVVTRGGGRTSSSAQVQARLQRGARAPEGDRSASAIPARAAASASRRGGAHDVVTAVAGRPAARPERASCSRCPRASPIHPKLATQLERRPRDARRGRHRLGPGRGARLRVACSSRASRSA